MGVFKEHAHAFETIAKKQKAIYNDACDFGFPYNTANAPQDVKALIHFVNDLKGSSLIVNREEWGNNKNGGVKIKIHIGWEIDEDMECGTEYNISFCKMNPNHPSLLEKGNNAFFSVEVNPYRKPARNNR